jgi:urea transport system permease protein
MDKTVGKKKQNSLVSYGSMLLSGLGLWLILGLGGLEGWVHVARGAESEVISNTAASGVTPGADISQEIAALASSDATTLEAVVIALGKRNDPQLLPLFIALREGGLYVWKPIDGVPQVVIGGETLTQGDTKIVSLFSAYGKQPLLDNKGQILQVPLTELKEIQANRNLRKIIKPFIDDLTNRLSLFSPDSSTRRASAIKLGQMGDPASLPLLTEALAAESDRWNRYAIEAAIHLIKLTDADPAVRRSAALRLGELGLEEAIPALQKLQGTSPDGSGSDPDPTVREAAGQAIKKIENWGTFVRFAETLFRGISLSSILLLMALGLAIVFGLMGVINMAHGELMMLGAYATYVMQQWFVNSLPPNLFNYYFLLALPFSFVVAGGMGLLLERCLIRFLYGRPLETLLATWGVSLILQQAVRQIFGAANVSVVSPNWLSGGIQILVGVYLPYNRLFIIGLATVCVIITYGVLFRSNMGLKIRAVTQNRSMSSCLGIATRRIDAWTFGFGAGMAGLAGCALSQIGNVGPDLGQTYVVDSFMVVVTGGVGKLAGSILAALGIGSLNKIFEPSLGSVFSKVAILILVILLLQAKPSGLFALKGRSIEN